MSLRWMGRLLADTVREWLRDKVPRLGAAMAFYSVLSLGPLLLIVISFAGIVFGEEAVSGHLFEEIRGLIGDEGAAAVQTVIANSRSETDGFWASLIGLGTLLIAATAVFSQLQDALNTIWNVKPAATGFLRLVKKRLISFALILVIGFLLLVSLVISAALAAFGGWFSHLLPEFVMQSVNFLISFGVVTVLFAMIFKILPDAHILWKDVWIGAALTALLFTLGKQAIGLYLGHSALSSTYGAAGSLIVILLWVYYSAQILFLGAEFTQLYARHSGSRSSKTEKMPEASQ